MTDNLDSATLSKLEKVNPQAYHQYMKRQREQEANRRFVEHVNRGYSHEEQARERIAKAHADHADRFISYEEQELDRRMAHGMAVKAQRDAESARQAKENEARAEAFRAEQQRQEQIIQDNIEKQFVAEFTANNPYQRLPTADPTAGAL